MDHRSVHAIGIAFAFVVAGCSATPTSGGVSGPPSASGAARGGASTSPSATPAAAVSGATSTPYAAATPVGFALPPVCSYIAPPIQSGDSRTWYVDCHAASAADARGPLVAAFTDQGWTACGSGPLRRVWAKGATAVTVTESPGGDTQLSESPRGAGQCP